MYILIVNTNLKLKKMLFTLSAMMDADSHLDQVATRCTQLITVDSLKNETNPDMYQR